MVIQTISAPQQRQKNDPECITPHININRDFSLLIIENFSVVFLRQEIVKGKKNSAQPQKIFNFDRLLILGVNVPVFIQKGIL